MYPKTYRWFLLTSLPLLLSANTFAQRATAHDTTTLNVLEEVVVTATKQQERWLKSPVSIERLSWRDIQQSAQPGFFDAIQNLKGLQVITPGMGFKVINARGFGNTTNVRFVQMADGIDNQAPHLGAPIANTLGPGDLDIYSVEVVPGTSSAMYGMNAINGIANFISKDPFRFPGVAVSQKSGVNNIHSQQTSATFFSETSLRVAQVMSNTWAIKFNGTFMKGTDWIADNHTDLNSGANASTGLTGERNPGKDQVNVYGDESGNRRTLTLAGKQYVVSRTGYPERDVVDYGIKNLKADASIYFRPTAKTEMVYTYRVAHQDNIYQRTNRFRFDNYLTQQQAITIRAKDVLFRTYYTSENTGNSYNIRSMAENIDRSFKSDNVWFTDFSNKFASSVQSGSDVSDAMSAARTFADYGRVQPNTAAMKRRIDSLSNINNWDIGAALRVKAHLFHAEVQHDITQVLLRGKANIGLMYGLDFRDYTIVPDGNYFINPTAQGKNLNYWKTGGFVQASKEWLEKRLKVYLVLRVDKNQYFDPKINPRLSAVFSPTQVHHFRLSVQNGFRFPSIFEAFSNINSGGRKRIGGLPLMSNGIFERSYTQTSITSFQKAIQKDVNNNGFTVNEAIVRNEGLLKKNPYTYLQPEKVSSFEAGYRAILLGQKLGIDVDFYYNIYHHLIAQIDANVPKSQNSDSAAFCLQSNAKSNLYRLWTNSKTVSYNYGVTLGAQYELSLKYKFGGNFTLAKIARKDQQDGLEDGFNTPQWTYNLFFGSPRLYKTIGFNINYRQQSAFLWQSALATGQVPSYATLDCQVNATIIKNTLNIKMGATNLLNNYYRSFIGGPLIGAFCYTNLVYGF